ncbi:MAG: hypothetical protein Q4B87_01190 [Candidatus Saccharibacteria bacterium]|nr:hypothetical protein [Candidatus Saccharibacteria bacterium]
MTTHVFIVNSNTFEVHLKYLFAGTGAKEDFIDFNNSAATVYSSNTENKLVGMSADACRIRRGDKIIFYLQQNFGEGIREGKFYGIFEATDNWSFLDNNDGQQYLLGDELSKSLLFRTKIKPSEVYPEGVTEWEALDSINNINSPNQMLWSLIYRKLKGNRGNTMITIYESEKLCQQIRNKNKRVSLSVTGQLEFDKSKQTIVATDDPLAIYSGRQEEINVFPRLVEKYNNDKAFEAHLQSYIVKNIGLGINSTLDNLILGKNQKIEWLGNEVSCGVGMQRIDIALSIIDNSTQRIFVPIELKAVEISEDNVRQVTRYIDWIEQYYLPNRQSDVQPIIIAKKHVNNPHSRVNNYERTLNLFRDFNKRNANRCNGIKYIDYEIVDGDLIFSEVNY